MEKRFFCTSGKGQYLLFDRVTGEEWGFWTFEELDEFLYNKLKELGLDE